MSITHTTQSLECEVNMRCVLLVLSHNVRNAMVVDTHMG